VGRLQRIEQRLESAVSGTFARLFRAEVQPVEVIAALAHELDTQAQIVSRDRALAPNELTVALSPRDHDRLAPYADQLGADFRATVEDHAAAQRYTFPGAVQVSLSRDDSLRTGQFKVTSAARASVSAPDAVPAVVADRRPPAVLEVNGRMVPVPPAGLLVGRGSDADLQITDPSVSRRHAEIRVLGEGPDADVVAVDLGSMNGITLNGQRMNSIPLRHGTTFSIGSTAITVHRDGR
jgi:hypothetical protein